MTAKALFRWLLLIICILALSACGVQPSQTGDSTTGQNPDSSAQTTQNVQIPLNYQSAIVNVDLKRTTVKPEISRLTYDSYRELMDAKAQEHDDCDENDWCYSPDTGECKILNRLKTVDYSEEFFSENTLLLITFLYYPDPFTVGNVTREGNIVTCTLDIYKKQPPDEGMTARSVYMSVFIAVDTVLPQETEFQVVKNFVPIEAEEYSEISNDFFVKYIL